MSPQAEIKTCNKTTRGLYCVCSWLRQHRFFLSTRPCNCHSLVPAPLAQSTNTSLLPGVLPCLCAAGKHCKYCNLPSQHVSSTLSTIDVRHGKQTAPTTMVGITPVPLLCPHIPTCRQCRYCTSPWVTQWGVAATMLMCHWEMWRHCGQSSSAGTNQGGVFTFTQGQWTTQHTMNLLETKFEKKKKKNEIWSFPIAGKVVIWEREREMIEFEFSDLNARGVT